MANSKIDYSKLDYTNIDDIKIALEEENRIKDELLDKAYDENIGKLQSQTKLKKRQAYNEAMNTVPIMRERYANLGLSSEGGTVKTNEVRFNTMIDSALAELDRLLVSESAQLSSEVAKSKLENLNAMLKELRSESTRIEELLYQRKQDEIQNALERRRVAAQEASVAAAKEKARQDALQYENEAALAAAKLVAQGAGDKSGSAYMEYLEKYAGDYLRQNGINAGLIKNPAATNKPSSSSQSLSSQSSSSQSSSSSNADYIKKHLFVIRHMNMSEEVKKDYFERY